MTSEQLTPKTVLLSAPWALYGRPSIQLGTLKAYLTRTVPESTVDVHHLYLNIAEAIGYRTYQAISEKTWLAESVYGALLFPERTDRIEAVFRKEAKGIPELRKLAFDALIDRVKQSTDAYLDEMNWHGVGLVGCSVCLCQLTASLYVIRRIKKKAPGLLVVVGGSTLAGNRPGTYLKAFTDIDFIVTGEGEQPLARLIRALSAASQGNRATAIPGVWSAAGPATENASFFNQLPNIDSLPVPDYDDYFACLQSLPPQKRFFPTLPVEMSRGCWWRRRRPDGSESGCAFCNLNLQWQGYRSKSPSRIAGEVDQLTSKFRCLSISFMDNLLPGKNTKDIFSAIANLKKDVRLFGEIRATTGLSTLEHMAAAGIREVQIGIEALSSRLLRKIGKGTTGIQNLEILKNCEALGISHHSNLILQFPGSDDQDVAETLHALSFSFAFRPLRVVHFWLGIGSAVWEEPGRFGIQSTTNHPYYAAIFPSQVHRTVAFMIQAYRGDMGAQRKRWKPVKDRVDEWKRHYAGLHAGSRCDPIMGYRDGREFLIIRERRLNDEPMTHRLVGTSRAIYLFCRRHRTLAQIADRFAGFSEEKLMPFLRMMADKRLMYEENGNYLSLAVPIQSQRQAIGIRSGV